MTYIESKEAERDYRHLINKEIIAQNTQFKVVGVLSAPLYAKDLSEFTRLVFTEKKSHADAASLFPNGRFEVFLQVHRLDQLDKAELIWVGDV